MNQQPNIPIMIIGFMWWLMSTAYFGWNLAPGSTAELFADCIALAFYAAAFAFPARSPITITINQGPSA
jgi:hypothetical protein